MVGVGLEAHAAKMKTYRLFGHDLPVKEFTCSLDGGPHLPLDPYFNLYIRMTDSCQAKCKFCEFHSNNQTKFNFPKFKSIIETLIRENIFINKIAFTGGEPSFYFDILAKTIEYTRKVFPENHITINTNGFNLKEEVCLPVDCIALSRHHYKDDINSEIFGTENIPSSNDIKDCCDDEKIHLRCNLIKGYIDSQEEMVKYMEESSFLGVNDFGFVSLMPLNQYCRDQFIDHPDLSKMSRTKLNYSQVEVTGCNCRNFLHYTEQGKIVQLYSRNNAGYSGCASSLVYDIDHLTIGFNGEKII